MAYCTASIDRHHGHCPAMSKTKFNHGRQNAARRTGFEFSIRGRLAHEIKDSVGIHVCASAARNPNRSRKSTFGLISLMASCRARISCSEACSNNQAANVVRPICVCAAFTNSNNEPTPKMSRSAAYGWCGSRNSVPGDPFPDHVPSSRSSPD